MKENIVEFTTKKDSGPGQLYDAYTLERFGDLVELENFVHLYKHTIIARDTEVINGVEAFLKYLVGWPIWELHAFKKKLVAPYSGIVDKIIQLKDFHTQLARYFYKDELEPIEGYVYMLLNNIRENVQRHMGGFCERIIYLKQPGEEDIIGGTNFSIFLGKNAQNKNIVTAQVSYMFIEERFRKHGLASELMKIIEQEARAYAFSRYGIVEPDVILFTEQSEPLQMRITDYMHDAGLVIDPCSRVKAWQKMGSYQLVFNYTQPPLSKGLEPVDSMTMNVHLPADWEEKHGAMVVPSDVVYNHLKMYIDLNIVKEIDGFETDKHCQEMIQELTSQNDIELTNDLGVDQTQARIYALFGLIADGTIPLEYLQKFQDEEHA